jgi:hypothetical protein
MPQSLASRSNSVALAAAISRHPAAGARGPVAAPAGFASFATVSALLTGPWRVNDPVAFAAAMRGAPLVAGHPVLDLWACAGQPPVRFDLLSATRVGHIERAVGGAADRAGLVVRWVAARGGHDLFVEAAGQAPADADGPELLVLAHLVEAVDGRPPASDDSWVVLVVGDGSGGVAGIGRAALPRQGAGARAPLPVRLALGALRARLVGPAMVGEGLADPDAAAPEAVILPFRR